MKTNFYFFLIGLCFPFFASAAVNEAIGKLALVNGKVQIVNGALKKDANPNDPIYNVDTVTTGDHGTAKILFTDQTILDVGPNSAIQVSNYALKDVENRTGTFALLYGKIRALISKKVGPKGDLNVRSGDMVMGVRGTEFIVDTPKAMQGNQSAPPTVMVLNGIVKVSPLQGGPSVSLSAGQLLTATPQTVASAAQTTTTQNSGASSTSSESSKSSGDQASSPVVQVSAEQMQSAASSIKAEDSTFMNSVSLTSSSKSGGNSSQQSSASTIASVGKLVESVGGLSSKASETAVAALAPKPPSVVPSNIIQNIPPVNTLIGNPVHLTVVLQ